MLRILSTPALTKLTCYFVSVTRVGRKIVREGYVHQARQAVVVRQRINQQTLRQNFKFGKTHTSNTCSEDVTRGCESWWITVCDELTSPPSNDVDQVREGDALSSFMVGVELKSTGGGKVRDGGFISGASHRRPWGHPRAANTTRSAAITCTTACMHCNIHPSLSLSVSIYNYMDRLGGMFSTSFTHLPLQSLPSLTISPQPRPFMSTVPAKMSPRSPSYSSFPTARHTPLSPSPSRTSP